MCTWHDGAVPTSSPQSAISQPPAVLSLGLASCLASVVERSLSRACRLGEGAAAMLLSVRFGDATGAAGGASPPRGAGGSS